MAFFVFFLYFISMCFALLFASPIWVIGPADLIILSGPVAIAAGLYEFNPRTLWTSIHIILAVLVHPKIILEAPPLLPHLSTDKQHDLLLKLHEIGNRSWVWNDNDMALLVRSLKADLILQFKLSNPFLFWIYPPSVLLVFWGVLFYFYPKRREHGEGEA